MFPGVSKLLQAGALAMIKEVSAELERAGKRDNLANCGYEIPLTIAAMGAGKRSELRSHWKTLLKNSMDPDFPLDIRIEDIEFANSLNASDAVLAFMIGRHRKMVHDEWSKDGSIGPEITMKIIEYIRDAGSNRSLLNNGMTLDGILKCYNTVQGAPCRIPLSELHYSLWSRGYKSGENNDKSKIFFLSAWISPGGEFLQSDYTQITASKDHPLISKVFFNASLTTLAQRWVQLATD